jgi:phage terminase large subunit GpA-like protein
MSRDIESQTHAIDKDFMGVLPRSGLSAKCSSRGRPDPLIEDSPALRERVKPARSRDAGNSMLSKEFPGGILVLTGANSATGLRSMPARYSFLDEVDAYPPSADEEGDPVTLAEARTTTFSHRRKVFMVSTPTIRGISRIEREYEASQRLKPEALRARVLADLAARSDAAGIIATAPAADAAKDSPIIAAAKKTATDARR